MNKKNLVDFNFSYLEGRPFGTICQNWLLTYDYCLNQNITNKIDCGYSL